MVLLLINGSAASSIIPRVNAVNAVNAAVGGDAVAGTACC